MVDALRAASSLLLLSLSLQTVAAQPSACAAGILECSSEHSRHENSVDGEADAEVADIAVSLLQHHKLETSMTTTPSNALRSITVEGGICLAASEGGEDGGVVRLATCDSAKKTQKWKYDEQAKTLKNYWDLCVHNTAGSGGVEMRKCDGSWSQRWEFSNTGSFSPMRNDGECLTAYRRNEDLAPVNMRECDSSRRDQHWQFVGDSDGGGVYPHRSIRVDGGICLAASQGSKEGGVVRLATCDWAKNAQKWKYDEGTKTLKNYFDLCVHNTAGADGVEMRTCDGSWSQRWQFSNTGGALMPMENDGKCLTAYKRNEDLAPVNMRTCDSSRREQMWRFVN